MLFVHLASSRREESPLVPSQNLYHPQPTPISEQCRSTLTSLPNPTASRSSNISNGLSELSIIRPSMDTPFALILEHTAGHTRVLHPLLEPCSRFHARTMRHQPRGVVFSTSPGTPIPPFRGSLERACRLLPSHCVWTFSDFFLLLVLSKRTHLGPISSIPRSLGFP